MKRNEEIIESYVEIMERETLRLLLSNEDIKEVTIREASYMNCQLFMNRGSLYAPDVDIRLLETKEAVDKKLIEALRVSKDNANLINEKPSFNAWF